MYFGGSHGWLQGYLLHFNVLSCRGLEGGKCAGLAWEMAPVVVQAFPQRRQWLGYRMVAGFGFESQLLLKMSMFIS